MPTYDPNNVFAKILRGELPCHKVYEDDKALAFLDIMPRARGHTLVLPKASARNIFDVAPDDLAHVIKIAQKIARPRPAGVRRRRRHRAAIQRERRRPSGLSPARSRHPARRRRSDEAAGERQGSTRSARRAGAENLSAALADDRTRSSRSAGDQCRADDQRRFSGHHGRRTPTGAPGGIPQSRRRWRRASLPRHRGQRAGRTMISLAMTPASTAMATARTHSPTRNALRCRAPPPAPACAISPWAEIRPARAPGMATARRSPHRKVSRSR